MSATSRSGGPRTPRPDDPRVLRTRAAAVAAARTLFLEKGYAGTTMVEIAAAAGLTKRTLYNNYADKETLFTGIVADVGAYADAFARGIRDELGADLSAASLRPTLDDLGRRLALGIVRAEVVAIRRLLIGEARTFPALARGYFERAPGQVIAALAAGFRRLDRAGLLRVPDARRAAGQFAYLVAGELLDRAVLTGVIPAEREIGAGAREGVETFVARYGGRRGR
ncbi:MAG TPA: TetR/AcrR family transcriptional regulator [Gemmatimonadales bacterium]|nr:TetR/AcrR family transcriptional regulator [Gemmatimonadales bacterium]